MQVMCSGTECACPVMEKTDEGIYSFDGFVSRSYIALSGISKDKVCKIFGDVSFIDCDECAFITQPLAEATALDMLKKSGAECLSRIRLL